MTLKLIPGVDTYQDLTTWCQVYTCWLRSYSLMPGVYILVKILQPDARCIHTGQDLTAWCQVYTYWSRSYNLMPGVYMLVNILQPDARCIHTGQDLTTWCQVYTCWSRSYNLMPGVHLLFILTGIRFLGLISPVINPKPVITSICF